MKHIHTLLILSYITFCASCSETRSCLKLTTSPPSYSGKLCPSEFNFYTFICDVSSAYVSWNFSTADGNIQTTFFGHQDDLYREHSGRTDDYEYYIVLHHFERVADSNYAMRSSLTIYLLNNSLTQFPVTCSTHCRQNYVSQSQTYSLAAIPTMPRHLRYSDPHINKNKDCIEGPQVYFLWERPENLDGFTLSHYEYISDDGATRMRFEPRSYHLNRNPSTPYNFEVYAVDKCGQEGQHAHMTIPAGPHEEL